MTIDTGRGAPPLSVTGAALWFGRNFIEALIWASTGAAVLVLLLAIGHYPQAAAWIVLSGFVLAAAAWATFGIRRTGSSSDASILQFDVFHFTIKVIVGTRRDPQRERP